MGSKDAGTAGPSDRSMQIGGRNVRIRETPESLEVSLDGVLLGVSKDPATNTYNSRTLTHQAFDSPEALAEALVATEGELWVLHGEPSHHIHQPHGPLPPRPSGEPGH